MAKYTNRHYANTLSALPTDARFWAIYEDSITYDSGYGDRGGRDMVTDQLTRIVWFDTKADLEEWVLENSKKEYSKCKFKLFMAEPVNFEITVSVSVKI